MPLEKTTSADGTAIAYERVGEGPALVLVGGAFCDRHATAALASALAGDFTAVSYDRRGRGDSGDAPQYAVRHEVADLDAVIQAVGAPAFVHGISSGGALALRAAADGAAIAGVSVLEPPYRVAGAPPAPERYRDTLGEFIAAGRRDAAVEYFMTAAVGQSAEEVAVARATPWWPALEAMAHTLGYDAEVMGDDSAVPSAVLARVVVPVLALDSTGSAEWLRFGARAAAQAVPGAGHRSLDGGFHDVPPDVLAPVLTAFFRRDC
jgi:Alpha/beta hydrolase family